LPRRARRIGRFHNRSHIVITEHVAGADDHRKPGGN
jgi:hypothetical protein